MQRQRLWLLVGLVAIGLASATPAAAQGYGVYEQSACASGRGGAGVASPCADGSSVYFNPAGLAFVPQQTLSIGGALIGPRGDFTNSTTNRISSLNAKWYTVPNIYYSQTIREGIVGGVGVFAPYGLTTDWPTDSEGRFLGYKSLVQGLYIQPTIAFRVNDRLAIGGGVDVTHVKVQLRQRLDLAVQQVPGATAGVTFAALGAKPGSDFADVDLTGSSWSMGFHFGAQAKVNDRVTVGARFMTGQTASIDSGTVETLQVSTGWTFPVALPGIPAGTPVDPLLAAQFQDGKALENGQGGSTKLPLPDQIVAGVAIQATPLMKVLIDYQYTRWSKFDQLVINKENTPDTPSVIYEEYKDTSGLRAGVEYDVRPNLTLRGGFVANTAAAPPQTVTPNLPEGGRTQYTVGLGARLSPMVRLDAFYLHLRQPERAGRSTDGGMARPTAAVNNGVYRFRANLFGAALTFQF